MVALGILLGASSARCTSPDGVPLDGLERRVRLATCRQIFDCHSDGIDSVAQRLALLDVQTCADATWIQPSLDAELAAVRAGLVRYDGVAAARCLDWLETTCVLDALFLGHAVPAACHDMLVGTLALGAPCDRDPDACAPGTYCETDGARCGVCVAQREAGAACGADRHCRDDDRDDDLVAVCVGSDFGNDGVCGRGSLLPNAGADGACGTVGTGPDGVTSYAFCGLGYHCPDFREPSYCRSTVAAGARCGSDSPDRCSALDACLDPVTPGAEPTCVPVEVSSRAGDTCEGDTAVACDEHAGLACDDGTCVRVGDGTEGSACAPQWSRRRCVEGLECIDGVCSRPGPLGAACDSDRDCASDACDHAAGICAEPPPSCG